MNAIKKQLSEYEQQAEDFCTKYSVKMSALFFNNCKHFDDDKEPRDVYEITIERTNKNPYVFKFGQSIVNSAPTKEQLARAFKTRDVKLQRKLRLQRQRPSSYDVLACIQKSCPGTFEEFCADMGYETDSMRANKTYLAVMNEWLNISRLFNEQELLELQEIA